jgi:hypothetical protein
MGTSITPDIRRHRPSPYWAPGEKKLGERFLVSRPPGPLKVKLFGALDVVMEANSGNPFRNLRGLVISRSGSADDGVPVPRRILRVAERGDPDNPPRLPGGLSTRRESRRRLSRSRSACPSGTDTASPLLDSAHICSLFVPGGDPRRLARLYPMAGASPRGALTASATA